MDLEIEEAPGGARVVATLEKGQVVPTRSGDDDYQSLEDCMKEPFLLLGVDISHLKREKQYMACATGLFSFSLLYGYLQELLSVEIFSRKLALFLSSTQFAGYTVLVYLLREYVYPKHNKKLDSTVDTTAKAQNVVPYKYYLSISLMRALELGLTNLAMQYINFPAKTLMKSSRVVFTMAFGVLVQRKSYRLVDYLTVAAMVGGLAIFLRADAHSDAVFHYMGVIMLILSLICDGVIVNVSESVMSRYGVGQDEFIFRVYSIALVAVTIAAAANGELDEGFLWLSEPGTYDEFVDDVPVKNRTWSIFGKIFVLVVFSSMGFLALSCCACITKNFGALNMSVTSTARKATTLFLSFFLFDNVFTAGHMLGIVVFVSALITKIILRRNADNEKRGKLLKRKFSGIDPNSASTINRKTENKGRSSGKETETLTLRHGTAIANSNQNKE